MSRQFTEFGKGAVAGSMKQRIYTDTSVIDGCFDEEFAEASGRLLNTFKIGEAIIVIWVLTLLELQDAPPRVRAALDDIPLAHREDVELTEEATALAERYNAAGVVVATKRVDA
jgi:hypothetical protein